MLKLGLLWSQFQLLGDFAELRLLSRENHNNLGCTADNMGSHKKTIGAFAKWCFRRQKTCIFFDREAFTCQSCLVHEEIPGFQNQAVGGNRIPGIQYYDNTWDNIFQRNILLSPVSQDSGLDLDYRQHLFQSINRASFLPESQKAAD